MGIFEVLYLDHLIDKTEECFYNVWGFRPDIGMCCRVFQQVSITEHVYVRQQGLQIITKPRVKIHSPFLQTDRKGNMMILCDKCMICEPK